MNRSSRQMEEESSRPARTIFGLLKSPWRVLFARRKEMKKLPPLPLFSGGYRVDPANREALYEAIEGK